MTARTHTWHFQRYAASCLKTTTASQKIKMQQPIASTAVTLATTLETLKWQHTQNETGKNERKNKKWSKFLTVPGIPKRSPIQLLTMLYVAYTSVIEQESVILASFDRKRLRDTFRDLKLRAHPKKELAKTREKYLNCLWYPVFPSGFPTKYRPGSTLLKCESFRLFFTPHVNKYLVLLIYSNTFSYFLKML